MPTTRQAIHAVALTCATFSIGLTHAAEFQDNVPLSLVQALLQSPMGGDVRVYSDVPRNFPDIPIPAAFSVLGGVDQGGSLRLILQTSADQDSARLSLEDSLTAAGFVDIATLTGMGQGQTGFVASGMRAMSRTFCRDDVGLLSTMHMEHAGANVVAISVPGQRLGSNASACAELVNPRTWRTSPSSATGGVMLVSNLSQHMPVLTLPDPATSQSSPMAFASLGMGSGSSSSGGTSETHTNFTSSLKIPELYVHFAKQIATQGWALDSESTGQVSATGNWIKIPDENTYLHGSFTVVQTSQSDFVLRFRLTSLDVEE